jgi:uncharacterized protein (TIGR02285 family)
MRDDLEGVYAAKRSFTNKLDAFIHQDTHPVKMTSVPNEYQLFNLIKRGRADFMFASHMEILYFNGQSRGKRILKFFQISGEPEQVDVYVACSDREIGRQVIGRIDVLLQQGDLAEAIRQAAVR